MIATAGGAMLAGVAEAEPTRIWFGRGGCVFSGAQPVIHLAAG